MPAYPSFIGPSNPSQTPLADGSRLINLYYEPNDVPSGKPALYSTPGARTWTTVADVGMRGFASTNDRTITVVGGGVYEVFEDGTTIKRGIVPLGADLTPIVMNGVTGAQAAIVSAGSVYVLNLLTNVVTGPHLTGGVTHFGMLDGFGVPFFSDLGKFQVSALNDFTSYDPSNFALRSSAPDSWRALLINPPDLWLIGSLTGDVWQNVGTSPMPFAPRAGATFKYGIAASRSLAAAGDSVFWVSQNAEGAGIVVQARGFVPQPVSTLAVEAAIARYQATSTITDAEALVFQWKGHTFYVLKFLAANATWVYDLRTGAWFEMGQWNAGENRYDAWHPSATTYAFGQHLTGERATSTISVLDESSGTEADGSPIVWKRIPPALRVKDGGRGYVDRFEVGIQRGLGAVSGQGINPTVMLRVSHDEGLTWGAESRRSFGRMGKRNAPVFWNNLGSSRTSWTPELTGSDPVPARLVFGSVQARGMEQ